MTGSFCLSEYQALLSFLTAGGWSFAKFTNIDAVRPRELILRHDIDAELYLLDSFLEMEAETNVQATYFVMPESAFYNVSSPEGRRITSKIIGTGHSIGLHFFGEIHAHLSQSDLESQIQRQATMLSETVGADVKAFSFHQPTQAMLKMNLDIPGLINTYHQDLMRRFTYVSDTNMNWRPSEPRDMITSGASRMQMLIHPLWWITEGVTPRERWIQVLKANTYVHAQHLVAREGTLLGVYARDLTSP